MQLFALFVEKKIFFFNIFVFKYKKKSYAIQCNVGGVGTYTQFSRVWTTKARHWTVIKFTWGIVARSRLAILYSLVEHLFLALLLSHLLNALLIYCILLYTHRPPSSVLNRRLSSSRLLFPPRVALAAHVLLHTHSLVKKVFALYTHTFAHTRNFHAAIVRALIIALGLL